MSSTQNFPQILFGDQIIEWPHKFSQPLVQSAFEKVHRIPDNYCIALCLNKTVNNTKFCPQNEILQYGSDANYQSSGPETSQFYQILTKGVMMLVVLLGALICFMVKKGRLYQRKLQKEGFGNVNSDEYLQSEHFSKTPDNISDRSNDSN